MIRPLGGHLKPDLTSAVVQGQLSFDVSCYSQVVFEPSPVRVSKPWGQAKHVGAVQYIQFVLSMSV